MSIPTEQDKAVVLSMPDFAPMLDPLPNLADPTAAELSRRILIGPPDYGDELILAGLTPPLSLAASTAHWHASVATVLSATELSGQRRQATKGTWFAERLFASIVDFMEPIEERGEVPIHVSYEAVNRQGKVRTPLGRTLKLPAKRRSTYRDLIPNEIDLPEDEDDE